MDQQAQAKEAQADQPKSDQVQNIQQPQNTQQKEQEPEVKPSDKEINWKAFKDAREADRKRADAEAKRAREKEEEAKALKAALDAVLNKPHQQQASYEEHEETEDQRIDRRVNEALAKRDKEYEQKRREEEAKNLPKIIKQSHPDFDAVCSADNLDYLDYHFPEISRALDKMPEGFEKWDCVYKTAKKLIPNTNSSKEQARAERNLQKPQSMSVPGVTNSNNNAPAFVLTEQRKAENYARMQKVINTMDSK